MPKIQLKRLFLLLLVVALSAPLAGLARGEGRVDDDVVTTDLDGRTVRINGTSIDGNRSNATFFLTIRGNEDNLHARELVEFVLTAVDDEGSLIRDAFLKVDFGNGRDLQTEFDRRVSFEHVWRKKGGYRLQFELYTQRKGGELLSRGKYRVEMGGPVRTFFQILGDTDAELDEEVRYRFLALEREARKVRGTLTIDWGDGTTEVIENFSKEAFRSHVYTTEGSYKITATLVRDDGSRPKSRSMSVEVTETTTVNLANAVIPINSARDIANFRVTSQVTSVSVSGSLICIFHTKAGQWPVKDGVEGNPWVAVFIGGQLHAGTYEWLRPGQVCKGITANNIGPHVKHGTLAQWRPKRGEQVWFFVSTHSRLGSRTSDERSEPFLVIWPY